MSFTHEHSRPRNAWAEARQGQEYNTWHRLALPAHCSMIDIDGYDYCSKCGEPLLLVEAAMLVRGHGKATTQVQRLARRAGLPAWLVRYELADGKPVSFLDQQVEPMEYRQVWRTPEEMAEKFLNLHDEHREVCPNGY